MSSRIDDDGRDTRREGIGSFLRNLLGHIPWSECAECREELTFAAPAGGQVRIDNRNGRTRVIGEERSDVSVCVDKRARAENDDAAQHLVDDIRVEGAHVEALREKLRTRVIFIR